MHLSLLIPELVWPEPADKETLDAPPCPGLDRLLARGRFSRRPRQSIEAALTGLFGHAGETPTAALRLLGENASNESAEGQLWMCADPVHLRLHDERLILADGSQAGITNDEARSLVGGLNEHFADLGRFAQASAERWYFSPHDASLLPPFQAPPLSAVAGRSVARLLPEIMHERVLRGLINEIQTFLHAHPVNRRREAQERETINSLWLWGSGRLPDRRESDFDGVWTHSPLARGLARAAGVFTREAPAEAATLLEHAAPGSHQFVLLDQLLAPTQYEDGSAYRRALSALDEYWFTPLVAALKNRQLSRISLHATTAYGALRWEIRPADAWKFWRRPKPLAALAQELATEA